MKFRTILFIALLFPLSGMRNASERCGDKRKYKVEVQFMQLKTYEGGAEVPANYYKPTPLANYKLLLVQLVDNDKPKVVGEVTTDENGIWRERIPNGRYGFIEKKERNSLKKGQFLPESKRSGDDLEYVYTSWTINPWQALTVMDSAITNCTVTKKIDQVCGLCP
jgi:hypothetical protein